MAKSVRGFLSVFFVLALAAIVWSYDPTPLQDICVADNESKIFINGKVCKDPKLATIDDFVYPGILSVTPDTNNYLGSIVTVVDVDTLPGLNTNGVAMVRVDFGIAGLNPPHIHNRAAELFVVIEGSLYAGFITNNPDHRLFAKVINKGDVICFPQGLIHFQINIGKTNAIGFATLTSQNPGIQHIGEALFASNPLISVPEVLTKNFLISKKWVKEIERRFKNVNSTI